MKIKKFILTLFIALSFIPLFTKVKAESLSLDVTWTIINTYEDHYMIQSNLVDIPTGTDSLALYVPENDYTVVADGGDNSLVSFMIGATEYAYYLSAISGTTEIERDYFFDLSDVQTDDLTLADTVQFNLLLNFTATPTGFFTYFDTNYILQTNVVGQDVIYYKYLSVFYEYTIYTRDYTPTNPVAPTGFAFSGWKTITETVYTGGYPLAEWISLDGVFRLYAYFTPIVEYDPVIDTPTPNAPTLFTNVLDALGLYNNAGFILIYVLLMIIVLLVLFKIGVGAFVMIVTVILITSIFWFFGFLPTFVSIIMILTFIIAIALAIQGGRSYE